MKNNHLLVLFSILTLAAASSCSKDHAGPDGQAYAPGSGYFVINEGLFNQGNGTVSYVNTMTGVISNDIFKTAGKGSLGDIPYSMVIKGNIGYIVVNNSGHIEVVDMNDFSTTGRIEGMASPRYIHIVDENKAYVTDLVSPNLQVIDLKTNTIKSGIYLGKASESIRQIGNKVFVCNWSSYFTGGENNTIQVIDAATDQLIDSVMVTKEPNSMEIDKQGYLWVLCSGGYMQEEIPALIRVNPVSLQVEKKLEFAAGAYPTDLTINPAGDTLYFINGGIYRMPVDGILPADAFINAGSSIFSTVHYCSQNGRLIVGDAIDFQQNGLIYEYAPDGSRKASFPAGIIPGFILNY